VVIPYGRQSINDSDIDAVAEVLRGDWLTTGPYVDKFEAAIADLVDAPGAAVVSNGTAALHVGYRTLGIKPGDEIITTPMTFVATSAMAMHEGATMVFADVQEDTGNIDPAAVEALITPKTRAIAAVDYAGHPVEIDELRAIADKHGLFFLEDGAHSIGSTYRGRPVGHDADITTFSFFPTKNMTTGEGGAVVSRDPKLVARARSVRGQGLVRDKSIQRMPDTGDWHQEVHEIAFNYRLPDVLCNLGLSQLNRLAGFKAQRAVIFDRYVEALKDYDEFILPGKRDYVDPLWHLFPIRVPAARRRAIFDYLRTNGVWVQVNYMPVHWHPVFEDLGYKRDITPIANAYYEGEISLPMFADLSETDQDNVIRVLVDALTKA
jgi:dTDP-4-amino-4,6-dideoxygalactose transaminase